jgi:DNA repair protein RadA/Sms
MLTNSDTVPMMIQVPPCTTQRSTDHTPNQPAPVMISNGRATTAPKILMPRPSGVKIKKAIHAIVASVKPVVANVADHGTRSAVVSAWIGSMFIVARNATHASDGGVPSHSDHCRITETAVATPAATSRAPAANQPVSDEVARRTSRAGSMVMTLPATNDAPVSVAEAHRRAVVKVSADGFNFLGMPKTSTKPSHVCTECGWRSSRWVGRCGECQTWGSVVETAAPTLNQISVSMPVSKAVPIGTVNARLATHARTGVAELDRVLGDGLVPGVVVLLAGEPGVGKSTLLLEVAARWARNGHTTLYVTGEESAAQVRLRAGRTDAVADQLYLAAETDLGTVLGHIEEVQPSLMVLDSVQTIGTAEADGSPGGVTQVREVTSALVRVAKRRGMAVIIVGHVTKDGTVAGPRLLEHLVDVVLAFEGDRHSGFRMVRATKNRFGPADEVGCFEMVDSGIVEVPDPSGLFTSQHGEPVPGTAVTVTMEGRRPLLAEVQALVAGCTLTHPRRIVNGVESGRLAMVLAVLERRCGVRLSDRDVYSSTVGGARVSDPAADLAVALAVSSAAGNKPLPQRIVALGEVGLAGELRRVPGTSRRLNEAARLGFAEAVIPAETPDSREQMMTVHAGLVVHSVSTLDQALAALGLRPRDLK